MSQPWTAWYWADYLSKTQRLTLAEHGAYQLLLAEYYMTGEPLPTNVEVLYRVCRCTSDTERSAVDVVLARFFLLTPDGYRNQRADEEIAKSKEISEKRRKAVMIRHSKERTNERTNEPTFVDTTTTTITTTDKNKKQAASAFVLPSWIPAETWQAYEKMRNKIRKPMTDEARELLVKKLDRFRANGHAPKQIIEESIANSWQGLFEPKARAAVVGGASVGMHHTQPIQTEEDIALGKKLHEQERARNIAECERRRVGLQ